MCAQRRLQSACASEQSHYSLRRPPEITVRYPKCAQRIFRSDCANAQADRNLPWADMSKHIFSDLAVHSFYLVTSSSIHLYNPTIITLISFLPALISCLLHNSICEDKVHIDSLRLKKKTKRYSDFTLV